MVNWMCRKLKYRLQYMSQKEKDRFPKKNRVFDKTLFVKYKIFHGKFLKKRTRLSGYLVYSSDNLSRLVAINMRGLGTHVNSAGWRTGGSRSRIFRLRRIERRNRKGSRHNRPVEDFLLAFQLVVELELVGYARNVTRFDGLGGHTAMTRRTATGTISNH